MARILAKAMNADGRPERRLRPEPPVAQAIADGSSLDVIEMDAASQRGIDDVREIRERAVLQPVEGGYKVYIIDEAHQLTTQAWNALLKLIEEPPPHLVFVFCTTDLARCSRPSARAARRSCSSGLGCRSSSPCCGASATARDRRARCGAGADRPRRARLVPRRGLDPRPARRLDLEGDLRPGRPAARGGGRGGSLFRLCDTIVDRDTAGALVQIEELAEQGQDLAGSSPT